MARNKHAAALFEVMGNKKGSASRSLIATRTPNWWFKSRAEPETAAAVDPNDPTTATITSSLIAPRIAAVEVPEAARPAARQTMSASRPRRDLIDPTRPAAVRPPVDAARTFQFDRMRREVKLRLPLAHAVTAAFTVMMIVALAYVMGKHESANAPELVTSETTQEPTAETPKAPPVKPNVLDVTRMKSRPPTAGGSTGTGASHPNAEPPRVRDHEFIPTAPMANNAQGMHVTPHAESAGGRRTIGLNYVIAQSYPSEEIATEAHDSLVKSGIPCTVEKGPVGWANPNWYSVVTTRGFEHIHTPDCENFKKSIEQAGEKFAGNGKFRRFEPMLYSWK